MIAETRKAIGRLTRTIALIDGEVQRLEAAAPAIDAEAQAVALRLIDKLRAQAEAMRGQVRALEMLR